MASNDDYAYQGADNVRHKLPQRLQERITAIFREQEDDGTSSWWAWFDAGWSSEMDPGNLHTDHERTKAEIITRIKNAVPCDCDDCKEELADRKKPTK